MFLTTEGTEITEKCFYRERHEGASGNRIKLLTEILSGNNRVAGRII
jgi:hypothetical protein